MLSDICCPILDIASPLVLITGVRKGLFWFRNSPQSTMTTFSLLLVTNISTSDSVLDLDC